MAEARQKTCASARLRLPKDYRPSLWLRETERAIKFIKDRFETHLARARNLTREAATLFVLAGSEVNDTLTGSEELISFEVPDLGARRSGAVTGQVEAPGLARLWFPPPISFVASEELVERYPGSTRRERGDAVCQECGPVFSATDPLMTWAPRIMTTGPQRWRVRSN